MKMAIRIHGNTGIIYNRCSQVAAMFAVGVLQLIGKRCLVAASSSFRQLVTESRASYDVAQEHAQ